MQSRPDSRQSKRLPAEIRAHWRFGSTLDGICGVFLRRLSQRPWMLQADAYPEIRTVKIAICGLTCIDATIYRAKEKVGSLVQADVRVGELERKPGKAS